MRLPNPLRWLRTRNAAIASRRAANAARTKGVVFETRTVDCGWPGCAQLPDACGWPDCRYGSKPDDLMAVADEVAETTMPPGCIWPSCTLDKACTPDESACEPDDPQPTYREQVIGEDIDIWDDARQKRRADR